MIIVSVTRENGEVLDTLRIDTDSYKSCAVYPDDMAAQAVKETIEEFFDVKD